VKTCEDVRDVLPDALPWIGGEALEIYDHLKVCLECTEVVEETAQTVETLRDFAPEAPAPTADFADRVMAALPPVRSAPVAAFGPRVWAFRAAAAALLFSAGLATGGSAGVQETTARRIEQPPASVPQDPALAKASPLPGQLVPVPVAAQPVAAQPVSDDPFGNYAAEAALVLQAVSSLETSDPEVMRLLSYHVQRTQLLNHGDVLLASIRDGSHTRRLEPLITGTQLILRKVRHVRPESAPQTLWTIREEVRRTGILDAYRELLAATTTTTNDPL
jgi:hypothetical protein